MPLIRSLNYNRPLMIQHAGETLTVNRAPHAADGVRRIEVVSKPSGAFVVDGVVMRPSTVFTIRLPGRLQIIHGGKSMNLHFFKRQSKSSTYVAIEGDREWLVVPCKLCKPTPSPIGRAPYRRPLAG